MTVKDIMKKLWKTNLSSEAKHRVTLVLIGVLAVNTLGLAYAVRNLPIDSNQFALGKTNITPTTTRFKNLIPTSGRTGSKPGATHHPLPTSVGGGTIPPPPDGGNQPFPGAPSCPASAHNNSTFHTLWNSQLRCHYDHEHGTNPFTPEVSSAFPGFNLLSLLGNVQIGHTNPSGPMENTHKHGGFKWQVQPFAPQGCAVGFESGTVAVSAAVIQYHNFGDYGIEFESRVHSAAALLRQCKPANPTDFGYIYAVQHIDYGQRVSGYQGDIVPYPDTPVPAFASGLAPYFTVNCIGRSSPPCGSITTRQGILDANQNTNSIWTSKSARRLEHSGSPLFALLFRVRDTYQILDFADSSYPFTFLWMCSNDGGVTYAARAGCRYNNSTSTVHEVQGTIPAAWDNVVGFDTDARVGRITADGFVSRFGNLMMECTEVGTDCHPIKMVNAFVGFYSSELSTEKVSSPTPLDTPERDVYFCNGAVCSETSPGAVSSGWIGQNN